MLYDDIRTKLAQREKELTNMIARIDDRTRVPFSEWSGELSRYDNHIDVGTDLFMRESDQVIRHRAQKGLEDVKSAKEALEQGTYGVCQTCGEPIDDSRLNVLPESRNCINCAFDLNDDKTYLIPQGDLEPNEFWDEMAIWGSSNTLQDGQAEEEELEDKPK